MDKHFTILLQPSGLRFAASDAATVLDAALLDGIRIPNSCRNGTCRTCMCRLESGSVSYRIEWPGLAREEKADGFILPCVAYAQSDLVIDVPAAQCIVPR